MNTRALLLGAALATLGLSAPVAVSAQTSVTEQEAHAIGVDAYLYFYSLLSMDVTRKQFTNVEPGKEFGKGPMNMFTNVPEYPPADFKGVVRSNFDTLYSIAWLDLTKEPMVVSVPDTGRSLLSAADARHVDGCVRLARLAHDRHAGGQLPCHAGGLAARFARQVVEQFKLPKDIQRIEAPTPYVWIIGRTKTDGPADYDAVHKIQAGYKVTPLSEWGKPAKPPEVKIDPSVDMKTPPKVQVDTMPAGKYFAYAAELLKVNPPHITDQPIVAQMKKIGIEPGKSFDIEKLDPAVRKALGERAR